MALPTIVRQQHLAGILPGGTLVLNSANDAGDALLLQARWREDGTGAVPTISDTGDGTTSNTWEVIYTSPKKAMWLVRSCVASPNNTITVEQHAAGTPFNWEIWFEEIKDFSGIDVTVDNDSSAKIDVNDGTYDLSITYAGVFLWAAAMVVFHGTGGEPQDLVIGMILSEGGVAGYIPAGWMDRFPSADGTWGGVLEFIGQKQTTCVPVGEIVVDICRRAGIDPSMVDVSLLTSSNLKPTNACCGYVVTRPTPAVNALRVLMQAYFFDACESEGKLRFIPRGLAPALTIPEADLGLAADKGKIIETIGQEQDLPRDVTVIYIEPAKDYQQGKQMKSRNSRAVKTKNQDNLEIPMTMDADFARQVAEKSLYLRWLEKNSYILNLWKAAYLALDATDVVEFIYKEITFAIRTTEANFGQGFATELNGVSHNDRNYLSAAVGGVGAGFVSPPLPVLQATMLFLFDLPLLRDQDANAPGTNYYMGMSSGSDGWKGANLLRSADDVSFGGPIDSDTDQMSFGYATTTLGAPPRSPWIFDNTNTLTVKMTRGALSSVSELDVLDGKNALIYGNEVIQYQNAVLNMDGTYTVSKLLRGRRGTEWAAGTHGAGELVVDPYSGIHHEPDSLGTANKPFYYRAVTAGADITGAPSQLFTNTGNDRRPYAVTSVLGSRDISSNLTVTWIRRTRIGGDWIDGVGTVPVSEDSEAYEVDVMNGSTVVRTISSSSPTISYSAADQTTDFGSPQASISLRIYQLSAQIGRGFRKAVTV